MLIIYKPFKNKKHETFNAPTSLPDGSIGSLHEPRNTGIPLRNLNKLITGTPFEDLPLEDIIRKADGGIFNNAAQTWNHTFFFETLTPQQTVLPDKLIRKLTENFGSLEAFKQEFTQKATTLFGSGWVWLVEDTQGKLSILAEPNAGNPLVKGMKPVLVLDVWEHAYYIDYRNRRAAFIEAFWNLVDWEKVASRIA